MIASNSVSGRGQLGLMDAIAARGNSQSWGPGFSSVVDQSISPSPPAKEMIDRRLFFFFYFFCTKVAAAIYRAGYGGTINKQRLTMLG